MLYDQIKTASDLKSFVENGPDSFFFTRDTMRFWGDTMRNYGVRKVGTITDIRGNNHDGVLELYRRRPVKHGLSSSAYFAPVGSDAARRVFIEA